MNVYIRIALACGLAVSLAACGGKNDNHATEILLSASKVSFPLDGGSRVVNIIGENFTTTTPDQWIIITPVSRGIEIVVGASPSSRYGVITVENGLDSKSIAVSQVSEKPDTGLTIDPSSLRFGAEGGNKTITVTSSIAWTSSSKDSWISLMATPPGTLAVTVGTNDTGAPRSGSITISNGVNVESISVSQGE